MWLNLATTSSCDYKVSNVISSVPSYDVRHTRNSFSCRRHHEKYTECICREFHGPGPDMVC